METMETKVNTTNETETAAHQTGMMCCSFCIICCIYFFFHSFHY